MALDKEQKGIVGRSALAILVTVAVLGAGYGWLPAGLFSLNDTMTAGDRIAFALKADVPIFLWLAACLRVVASGRIRVPTDRKGAAYGKPSPGLAIRIAILQNSLEQTVLAVGANLALVAVLHGSEPILIPLSVLLYLGGRASFAVSYSRGAVARSFGMALTAGPIIAGYIIAAVLMIAGR